MSQMPTKIQETTTNNYKINMEQPNQSVKCPVPEYPAMIKGRYELRHYFLYKHVADVIKIVEEETMEWCPQCKMFVPTKKMNWHKKSKMCLIGQDRVEKWEHLEQKAQALIKQFTVDSEKIKMVNLFKYLGRMMMLIDDNITVVQANIKKAQAKWARVSRILSCKGADPRTMGYFYKAIIQSILLYGSETWVITMQMLKMLNGFHQQCAQYIARDHIQKVSEME